MKGSTYTVIPEVVQGNNDPAVIAALSNSTAIKARDMASATYGNSWKRSWQFSCVMVQRNTGTGIDKDNCVLCPVNRTACRVVPPVNEFVKQWSRTSEPRRNTSLQWTVRRESLTFGIDSAAVSLNGASRLILSRLEGAQQGGVFQCGRKRGVSRLPAYGGVVSQLDSAGHRKGAPGYCRRVLRRADETSNQLLQVLTANVLMAGQHNLSIGMDGMVRLHNQWRAGKFDGQCGRINHSFSSHSKSSAPKWTQFDPCVRARSAEFEIYCTDNQGCMSQLSGMEGDPGAVVLLEGTVVAYSEGTRVWIALVTSITPAAPEVV
ncbi:uncharacterized protein MELLADRAFT_107419 [Melampsora larici-populina 98AG31]|uniref:Uncharacterized protein n=1 Tax=Melampsora larici-populina (strain 98AG31 / pathotype 3-4-7) TaxID=747676 RepID=F4RPQ7_MELLP|nr:uncharacterized protein MELLADRAFT_107419 [Melampsora larici-populina 98AG31]EGG05583.1 hypothetical protein MELLADRAFT_107419 [Melampsora larici-populina 98AG31]